MELLIVIMIVNILAAVAITLYIGIREKTQRAAVLKIATASKQDLQHWLQSSFSQRRNSIEVDTDFNGQVDSNDKTNGELLNNIVGIYIDGRNNKLGEVSPWFNRQLWSSDDPPQPGTISLTQIAPSKLKLVATEKNGKILADFTITVE